MGSISSGVNALRHTMKRDICFLGMMAALLALCESEAQFGFGGGAALQNCVGSNCNQNNGFGGRTFGSSPGFGSRGGVAVQNCVGSNCNSNNVFGRKRREVLEEVIARVEEEPNTERRRLLEEILTEVEEFELSGERRQPSQEFTGSSSGLANTSDLLQQIVEKVDELRKFGSASRSALPVFPAGTKFYTSDGRGGLSAIEAPVISVPLEKSHFDNNPAKRTEEIGDQLLSLTEQVKSHFDNNPGKKTEETSENINFLTEQERREITKLLLKKLLV